MKLNPNAPIPLYRQLADLIAAQVRSGALSPGSRIPSEHQLAAVHQLGRPTVRQAIDRLVRKGLLVRRRGSGTYVCEPRQEIDLFSLDGTSASFRKKGVLTETRIVAPLEARIVAGQEDNPFYDRRAYCFSRLTLAGGIAVLLEDLYLDADLFAGIESMDLAGRSLSALAEERFFLRPSGGRQIFKIGYAAEDRARQLAITTETPLLLVQRVLHFPQMENGFFSELWCRSDQFTFSQTLGGAFYA